VGILIGDFGLGILKEILDEDYNRDFKWGF